MQLDYAEFAHAFPKLAKVDLAKGPEQVHLSYVDEDSIMVMWVTKDNTTTTTCEYGTGSSSNISVIAFGSTHAYTTGQ